VRDPVLDRARPAFEQGAYGITDDLRRLVQASYDVERAGLAEAAFPGINARTGPAAARGRGAELAANRLKRAGA
jgi:hypothetical protein